MTVSVHLSDCFCHVVDEGWQSVVYSLGSHSSWLFFCCCMWWWQLHLWWCQLYWACCNKVIPDSKVHGANMGPTWVLSAPDDPHVGPMNLVIKAWGVHTMDMLWEKFQWFLPLYMKSISFQSKASVVYSVTTAVVIDFCLKKINVFSQHIGKKTNEYLNSAEQIPRNWNVDHVPVLITSWDIT